MANVYVYSGGSGAGGTSWATAYQRYDTALTSAAAAGNVYWIAHDHAGDTTAAGNVVLTSPGTIAAPCRTFVVNRGGSVPPVEADLRSIIAGTATASVSVTGANNAMYLRGVMYCYGLLFQCGSAANGTNGINFEGNAHHDWTLENCKLAMLTTVAATGIFVGGNNELFSYTTTWINTAVKFAAISHAIYGGTGGSGKFLWRDTAAPIDATGTIPTTLFNMGALTGKKEDVECRNVDFSVAMTSGTLVGALLADNEFLFDRCKVHASVTKAATPAGHGASVTFLNTDSGSTNYKVERYTYMGTQTMETTIVRTGTEATDGTTPVSIKLAPTADNEIARPMVCTPLKRWNSVSGSSITVTVYGIWSGGAVPNNNDIWMDVEYPSSTGTLGARATTGMASLLSTPAALTTDSSTWGGSTTKFKMTATFTPGQVGVITIRIYVGASSGPPTIYIDPVPAISGQAISKAFAA